MSEEISVKSDFITREGKIIAVHGVYGVIYNATILEMIDANIESLRKDHPDIDRLLEARLVD